MYTCNLYNIVHQLYFKKLKENQNQIKQKIIKSKRPSVNICEGNEHRGR